MISVPIHDASQRTIASGATDTSGRYSMLSASSSSVPPSSWKIETKRTKKSPSSMPTGSWFNSHCGLRRDFTTRAGSACERRTNDVT